MPEIPERNALDKSLTQAASMAQIALKRSRGFAARQKAAAAIRASVAAQEPVSLNGDIQPDDDTEPLE